jgi:hypothetical protein
MRQLHRYSDSVTVPVLAHHNTDLAVTSASKASDYLLRGPFSPLGGTRLRLSCSARRHSVVHVFFTRPPRTSRLGRSARRHSVTPHITIGWSRPHKSAASHTATRLCTFSPLGRPARRNSVVHVFSTRPLRASPLGCARLHHSTAPRVTTRLCTSSPLGRPARRHSVVHILTPRPPRASLSVGHVFITTPQHGND